MEPEDVFILLRSSKKKELTVKEAVEIIELVTPDPAQIRHFLEEAEKKGIIKRVGKVIMVTGAGVFRRPKIRRAECRLSCRRCKRMIKNCHYIDMGDHELGPFGSECVQKLT